EGRRFRSFSAGLSPITAPKGTLVMCSATPGTVIDEANAGVFVAELLKELRVAGLGAEEVFNRTRIDVSRASKGQQVPWFSSSLGEEFAFGAPSRASAGPSTTRVEPRAEPKPDPAPAPAPPQTAEPQPA